MMRRLITFLAACIPAAALAAEPAPLPSYTLDECLAIGLEQATRIVNARRDERIAGAQVRQTKAQIYPQLDTDAAYTRKDEVTSFQMGDQTLEMGQLDNYSASASLSQVLYSGGKVAAAIRAARRATEYAAQGTDQARRALIRDIRLAFYNILLAQANVEVAAESVKQLEELAAQTEQKFRSGTASEFDLLSAQVRVANERPKLVRARDALAVSKESFRDLIYLEAPDFELRGELAYEPMEADLGALQEQGLATRPDVRQMETYLRLLGEDIKSARGDYYPEIKAVAAYSGTDPDQSGFGATGWGWHWTAGLTAHWSIMDGGLRSGVLLEKNLTLLKERSNYEDLKRGVRLEVKQAYLDMIAAREVLAGADEGVALAEKALEIARTRFEQGLSTYLEFTDANLALNTARLTRLTALKAHLGAVTSLRYACGATEDFEPKEPMP